MKIRTRKPLKLYRLSEISKSIQHFNKDALFSLLIAVHIAFPSKTHSVGCMILRYLFAAFLLISSTLQVSAEKPSLSGTWLTEETKNGLILVLDVYRCGSRWCARLAGLKKGSLPKSSFGKRVKVKFWRTVSANIFGAEITAIDDKKTYIGSARVSKNGQRLFFKGCTRDLKSICRTNTWRRSGTPTG